MVGCGMSYVRSLWVVIPLTLAMVAMALCLDGFAVFSGAFVGYEANLSKSFLLIAAFGLVGAIAGGAMNSPRSGLPAVGSHLARPGGLGAWTPPDRLRALAGRKPGDVSLSVGAAFFISSVIVGVISILI